MSVLPLMLQYQVVVVVFRTNLLAVNIMKRMSHVLSLIIILREEDFVILKLVMGARYQVPRVMG